MGLLSAWSLFRLLYQSQAWNVSSSQNHIPSQKGSLNLWDRRREWRDANWVESGVPCSVPAGRACWGCWAREHGLFGGFIFGSPPVPQYCRLASYSHSLAKANTASYSHSLAKANTASYSHSLAKANTASYYNIRFSMVMLHNAESDPQVNIITHFFCCKSEKQ
jgi:hypothetical protein